LGSVLDGCFGTEVKRIAVNSVPISTISRYTFMSFSAAPAAFTPIAMQEAFQSIQWQPRDKKWLTLR
jgi:hypothetical protein